jgi:hypothetical protein
MGGISDGEFLRPWIGPAFSWSNNQIASIEFNRVEGEPRANAALVNFSGDQPEAAELFWQFVAVQPGRQYRLSFMSRRLGFSTETGVQAQVIAPRHTNLLTVRAPLAQSWQTAAGVFTVPAGVYVVHLAFQYVRPAGEVRLHDRVAIARPALRPLEH